MKLNMKRSLIYIASLAAAVLMTLNAEGQTKKATVQTLSTAEFNEKVYDINADEMKYKVEMPAIVDFFADW